MKIITVEHPAWKNKDGKEFWVKTGMRREKDGGVKAFFDKLERNLKDNNASGIYLYDVKALNQSVMVGKDEESEPEIIYYIRWKWIKENENDTPFSYEWK